MSSLADSFISLLVPVSAVMTAVPGIAVPPPVDDSAPQLVAKVDRTRAQLRAPVATPTEIENIVESAAFASPLDALVERAILFGSLEDGWDGEGSIAPATHTLDAALDLIDRLPGGLPLPGVMVTADGEIGFYWDLQGGYADLSFSSTGEASFFSRSSLGKEVFIKDLRSSDFSRAWFFDRLGAMAAPARRAA